MPALHDATAIGDVEEIRRLVANGADVNKADEDGLTPMHVAAAFGHDGVITLLHSHGGEVNQADEDGRTPMHAAASEGHEVVITLLHSHGGEVNQADDYGETPMHYAALFGHEVVIALLHSFDADVNRANNNGLTPMHVAAQYGHEGVIALLKSHGGNINQAAEDDRTPMHAAAKEGHEGIITLLHSFGADVNQADKDGHTPLSHAAWNGHTGAIKLLHSLGADVNQGDKDGTTPIIGAVAGQHYSAETLLRGLGAAMPADGKELVTVDDVVQFFNTLCINRYLLPIIEKNIRLGKIDAATLFAASNEEDMNKLLGGVFTPYNKHIYYNVVKRHKTIQEDRAQSAGAAERAAKALKSMDDPKARDKMYNDQLEFFRAYFEIVLQSFDPSEGVPSMLKADAVHKVLQGSLGSIAQLAKQEEVRLGEEVTTLCLIKYQELKERWRLLENLPAPAEVINVQPIAYTSFGLKCNGVFEGSPLGLGSIEDRDRNPDLDRLEHLLAMAKVLSTFFQRQMKLVTEKVNNASNPQSLGLSNVTFPLPFNSTMLASDGERAALTFGPIKQPHRALAKAKEYAKEMKDGIKLTKLKNGVPISPSDYVLDLLRCTIEVEDPYLVAVIFFVLEKANIATCLRVCRVKNKFVDKKLSTHIQTNVLMNLCLLYPSSADEFEKSGLMGKFNPSMVDKCLMVCELQITMKDFLTIKRLQHSYYDITRVDPSDLANHLLMNGAFIDTDTLEKKVPSVVKEMENAGVKKDDKKDTNDKVKIDIDDLKRENGKLKLENETKIDGIEELKLKINKLENEMRVLKLFEFDDLSENDKLKLENEKLKLENEELKLKINKL